MTKKATPEEFRQWLKESAKQLVSGEKEFIGVPLGNLEEMIDDDEFIKKVDQPYIRITMMRVPEVQKAGRIRMKKVIDEDRGTHFTKVWFEPGAVTPMVKKQDYSSVIEAGVRHRFGKLIKAYMPDITDFDGTDLEVAAEIIRRYRAFVVDMLNKPLEEETNEH